MDEGQGKGGMARTIEEGHGHLPDCRKKGSERDEPELSKATELTRRKKGTKAILAMHRCKSKKHPAFFESWQVCGIVGMKQEGEQEEG